MCCTRERLTQLKSLSLIKTNIYTYNCTQYCIYIYIYIYETQLKLFQEVKETAMKGTWNFVFHNFFFQFSKVLIKVEMIYGFKIFENPTNK